MANLAVGDVVPLVVEKPAAGGRMIARANGLVVLVAGAIPGERVHAAIERLGKGVGYATVRAIDEASPDRRLDAVDIQCGGCLYAHIAYPRQLELKSAIVGDAFARIAHLDVPNVVTIAASPEAGYRMRARAHVRGGRIGFFREGTHDLCDARATRQLLPDSCDALDRLAAGLQAAGASMVQEVELTENVDASQRVVHLDATSSFDLHALDRLATTEGITGLSSFRGSRGSTFVNDTLMVGNTPVVLRRHVLAFFQGNRFLLNSLATDVVEQLAQAQTVIDLFAGVGLLSAAAAAGGAKVIAIEGDRVAAADLQANALAFDGRLFGRHLSVEEFVRRDRSAAEAIILDPPRTGLSRAAQDGILAIRAPRIVYVSCDVATLARDARRFVDSGYRLARLKGFDLFPNTPHVETVAVFRRD